MDRHNLAKTMILVDQDTNLEAVKKVFSTCWARMKTDSPNFGSFKAPLTVYELTQKNRIDIRGIIETLLRVEEKYRNETTLN